MTNEQARKILCEYLDLDKEEHNEFLDAIRTLIQTIDEIERIINCDDPVNAELKRISKELDGLTVAIPSAEPKTGHWILADEQNKEDVENDNYLYICSKCQCFDIHAKGTIVPYCWKCGAKMIEEMADDLAIPSAEPSGDLISRQAVIENEFCNEGRGALYNVRGTH